MGVGGGGVGGGGGQGVGGNGCVGPAHCLHSVVWWLQELKQVNPQITKFDLKE